MNLPKIILGASWVTGTLGCVGVVAVERVNGWKAYCGPVDGYNEKVDTIQVAAHGGPLTEDQARGFFPHLSDKEYAA